MQDSLPDQRGTSRRLPDSLRRCKAVSQTGGAPAVDSETSAMVPRPCRHLQEPPNSLRRCQTVSVHLEETPRQSATVQNSLQDRWGTCRILPDSLRRCQDRLVT
ncbi:hypothetical protein DPMN_097233 [Dreissena polymorpha]|uniref:Uncharacterized protein n=1 Tax=Dreissena polymorpha TaxID=45954 RepID=A0A9D4R668_DREPO|nr:hypothetical protein DPMN_097233 [Dreissena polymorpha]